MDPNKLVDSSIADPTKIVGGQEFVEEGGQSLYRFLLDEGMVNSSARAREVELLIADTAQTGFLQKVWKRLGSKTQKFLKGAQELYIAEDDAWKIFNFFGESYRIRSAYEAAIKAGKIKLKDVPGGSLDSIEILQMATKPQVYTRPGANTMDPNKLVDSSIADPTKIVGGQEFVEEGGQSLYRFLLDEGMVNSSARAREVELLIADTAQTGFLQKVWKRLGSKTQKFLKGAQELYIAEDDAWKIFNFFGESYRIRSAYEAAIKAGKIKLKDVPGGSLDSIEILRMATKKVRDMLPNYNYVSPFIKGMT
jgi:uncharacterized lipoprotein YbaY